MEKKCMGKIKGEGGRKLHQALNRAALGHGVYGQAVAGRWKEMR